MANLVNYSETNYRLSFTRSFYKQKLSKNYFVHSYGSPYDTLSFVDYWRDMEIGKVTRLFDYIFKKYVNVDKEKWKLKEKNQLLKLKIYGILLAQTLGNEDKAAEIDQITELLPLTREVNKLYKQYYESKTLIYNDNGYINSFFVLALESILKDFKKLFPQLYKEELKKSQPIRSIWNSQISMNDFINKISNEKYWQRVLGKDPNSIGAFNVALQKFIDIKMTKIVQVHEDRQKKQQEVQEKNNKKKNNKKKGKEIKNGESKDGKGNTGDLIYYFELKILEYMKNNPNLICSKIVFNTISNVGTIFKRKTEKSKIGQIVGNSNEEITQWLSNELFEDFFSKDLTVMIPLKAAHTGPQTRSYIIEKNNKVVYSESGDIKTDVSVDVDIDELSKILNNKSGAFKKTVEDLSLIGGKNAKINLSVKNFNEEGSRDLRVQSNNNLISYAAILSTQLKEQKIYDMLGDNELLHYFLLNETVSDRRGRSDFRAELSRALEKAGFLLLTGEGFVDDGDEIDFLMLNQKIIPTALIQEIYLNELESAYKDKLNKMFMVHIKGNTNKTSVKPTIDDSQYNDKAKVNYLYHDDFLQNNKQIGINQFKKLYFYTEIVKGNFKQKILDKIFETK